MDPKIEAIVEKLLRGEGDTHELAEVLKALPASKIGASRTNPQTCRVHEHWGGLGKENPRQQFFVGVGYHDLDNWGKKFGNI